MSVGRQTLAAGSRRAPHTCTPVVRAYVTPFHRDYIRLQRRACTSCTIPPIHIYLRVCRHGYASARIAIRTRITNPGATRNSTMMEFGSTVGRSFALFFTTARESEKERDFLTRLHFRRYDFQFCPFFRFRIIDCEFYPFKVLE